MGSTNCFSCAACKHIQMTCVLYTSSILTFSNFHLMSPFEPIVDPFHKSIFHFQSCSNPSGELFNIRSLEWGEKGTRKYDFTQKEK